MSLYKLIAFDMDGTLLNSEKKITPSTAEAVHRAMAQGIYVVFNTGRCMAELREYFSVLDVPYINSVSGALVLDRQTQQTVYSNALPVDIVSRILEIAAPEDIMIHLLIQQSIVQKDKIPQMDRYHMGVYRSMYEKVTDKWDDLSARYQADPFPVPKVNLYHTSPEARTRTRQKILAQNLSVEMIDAESTSLEISAKGLDKGIGLEKLCSYLHLSMSEVVVVGDADNDAEAMKKAGLSIAMGNANDRIKSIADTIVNDNDHDGCKEALERFFFA